MPSGPGAIPVSSRAETSTNDADNGRGRKNAGADQPEDLAHRSLVAAARHQRDRARRGRDLPDPGLPGQPELLLEALYLPSVLAVPGNEVPRRCRHGLDPGCELA